MSAGAQRVRQLEHQRALCFFDTDQEHIDTRSRVWQQRAIPQQFREYDIAHTESRGRQIDVAHRSEEPVIASATADGAQLALSIEDLEHGAGIVCEPPHDRWIEADELTEVHLLEA